MEQGENKPASGSNTTQKHSLSDLMFNSGEGRVLLIGITLTLLYTVWLMIQLITAPAHFQTLIAMTATEVVFGRVACMAFGYSMNISHTAVILIAMLLETILVLVFYPLFVFTWRQLLVIKWLKKISNRTRQSAERHKEKVRKYGILGLFVFVWLPFWMTGPVVGCMIGYLLGMRIWVTLFTVLTGTYVAILGWAWLIRHTISLNSYIIVIIVLIAAAAILTWIYRHRLRKNNSQENSTP